MGRPRARSPEGPARRRAAAVGRVCAALAAACLILVPGAGRGQPAASYEVTAQVRAADGGAHPGAGAMVRVELGYLDPATGRPADDLQGPIAFLRTVKPGQDDCAAAVRAYSLNKSMFRDASALTGRFIVAANADGTLGFVDPLANLATANIFEVVQLPEPAAQIHAFRGDVAALLPKSGTVALVDTSGQVRTLAQGLDDLSLLAVADPVLLAAAGRHLAAFDPEGTLLYRHAAETRIQQVVPLADAQGADTGAAGIAILDAGGAVTVIDALDGRARAAKGLPAGAARIAGNRTAMLVAGTGPALGIHYPASGRTLALDAGFPIGGVAADGLGRHGFAWSAEGDAAVLVDLARAVVIDRFALPVPPAEALFAGASLFLNHRDDADLTLIDTGPLAGGGRVAIRTYAVAAHEPGPTPMAVHDPDNGWIVALPRGLSTANVYGNGNPTAPMTTTALRGARPLRVLGLDRRFRSTREGTFVAFGRLPAKGPVQLVTIADAYRTIRCFDVASSAPVAAPEPALRMSVQPPPHPGTPFTVRLVLENDRVPAARRRDTLRVQVRDMFGNRKEVLASRQPDGAFAFTMTIAAPGQYPVSAELDGFPRPALLTVGDGS